MVKGTNVRTSPIKKDLFVYIAEDIPTGFGNLGTAATIEPHKVNIDEMRGAGPSDSDFRVKTVNFNHNHAHIVDQSGVWLFNDALQNNGDEIVLASGWSAHNCPNPGPPECIGQFITIDVNKFYGLFPNCPSDLIAETIIHEIGHAIDIKHHNGLFHDKYGGVLNCYMRYYSSEEATLLQSGNYTGVTRRTTYCATDDDCREQIDASDEP